MATNLSRTESTANFYTPLHRVMTGRSELPPTSVEFADWLLKQPRFRRALDVGAGAHGFQTQTLRRTGTDVVAVDLNPDAARTVGGAVASALELPFADCQFDLVVCTGVAHHTADPWRALRELARVLEPGGVLYLSMYAFARSPAALAVRLARAIARLVPFSLAHRLGQHVPAINNFALDHMYVPVLWLFTAAEVEAHLVGTGLNIVASEPSSINVPFGAGDGLLRIFVARRRGTEPCRTQRTPNPVDSLRQTTQKLPS